VEDDEVDIEAQILDLYDEEEAAEGEGVLEEPPPKITR
jgi:hypothetical protein